MRKIIEIAQRRTAGMTNKFGDRAIDLRQNHFKCWLILQSKHMLAQRGDRATRSENEYFLRRFHAVDQPLKRCHSTVTENGPSFAVFSVMLSRHPACHGITEYRSDRIVAMEGFGDRALKNFWVSQIRAVAEHYFMDIKFIEACVRFPAAVNLLCRFRECGKTGASSLQMALHIACDDPLEALPAACEPLTQDTGLLETDRRQFIVVGIAQRCLCVSDQVDLPHVAPVFPVILWQDHFQALHA